MFKSNSKSGLKADLQLAAISITIILIGIFIAVLGSNIPGQLGSALLIAGIVVAIVGGIIGAQQSVL